MIKKYGKDIGDPTTGTFVMPKDIGENVIQASGGNPRILERMLGLDAGSLGDTPIRIDIDSSEGMHMASGNEAGSRWNENWRPGGYTHPGGIPEMVANQMPEGSYSVSTIIGGK